MSLILIENIPKCGSSEILEKDMIQTKQKIKFSTSGLRALIGEDFTKENICCVAQGIVELMKSENKTDKPVIIGYTMKSFING